MEHGREIETQIIHSVIDHFLGLVERGRTGAARFKVGSGVRLGGLVSDLMRARGN